MTDVYLDIADVKLQDEVRAFLNNRGCTFGLGPTTQVVVADVEAALGGERWLSHQALAVVGRYESVPGLRAAIAVGAKAFFVYPDERQQLAQFVITNGESTKVVSTVRVLDDEGFVQLTLEVPEGVERVMERVRDAFVLIAGVEIQVGEDG